MHLLTWPWPGYPGSVAPDGTTAAIVADGGNGNVTLEKLSLTSGAATRIGVRINEDASSDTMAWSPDSQWLFVVAASGKLLVVSTRTDKVMSLGVPGTFSQLAIRPAAG